MYLKSQLDKDNQKWFDKDKRYCSLKKISIEGRIRGIEDAEISFGYPITAIVGENGSGKSTVLALVACAFHNTTSFIPESLIPRKNKKLSKIVKYYTYKDFFVFSSGEAGISEVKITSEFLDVSGCKCDVRKKKPSGKWNDFNTRPSRVVSYLGVNRLVPPAESSAHRSYRKGFKQWNRITDAQKIEIVKSASRILGKAYDNLEILHCQTYSLFKIRRRTVEYTGFNMGAGENVVFNLLIEIMCADDGALIVVDEIELGLHAQAQKKLIEELKKICLKKHCQIICSTHSKEILDSIPMEGRVFISKKGDKTHIIPQISSDYAFGMLKQENSRELDVFVEDDVAELFLNTVINPSLRKRIIVKHIGSADSILSQMAACYRENRKNYIVFLDGDKRSTNASNMGKIRSELRTALHRGDTDETFEVLIEKRLNYLPGSSWPEKHILEKIKQSDSYIRLSALWNVENTDVENFVEAALLEECHQELHKLACSVNMSKELVMQNVFNEYKEVCIDDIHEIEQKIETVLDEQ